MDRIMNKHFRKIVKEEGKLLNQKEIPFIKEKVTPIVDKLQEKIPAKLKDTLETVFYKSFQLVFDKGTSYIEKTYNKDNIQLEFDLNNYALDKKFSNKFIRKLDKQSNQSKLLNSSISVVEGGVLGFLGIGLPDIPVFIALIVKTIYEIALSYGYDYNKDEEKAYVLQLICASMTKGDIQKEFNESLDSLSGNIDQNRTTEIDLEGLMKTTSKVLSESLLTAKFIQGIPVVGSVGGLINYNIINKVSRYSTIKYKKRYLIKKSKI
jgi:hypothetical protein